MLWVSRSVPVRPYGGVMTETGARAQSDGFKHHHVVFRLPPARPGVWRRLERVLAARWQLHSAALRERCDAWRLAGISVSWQHQFRGLTVCRWEDPEMAAVPAAVQRGTLKRLNEAMKGFFRRVKADPARTAGQKLGFPRFQGHQRCDSIAVVSGVRLATACPDLIRVSRGQAPDALQGKLPIDNSGHNIYIYAY